MKMDQQRVKEVLKARARALAQPAQKPDAAQVLHVVEFRLARERYALEQSYVREIHPLKELCPLPCTPSFVAGLINVRGKILPVIDIKKLFDLPDGGITDLHMVITVRADDFEIGILADTVTGIRAIPLETLQPSLPTLSGIRAQFLKGVTAEHVVVLDAARILTDPKLLVEEEVGT